MKPSPLRRILLVILSIVGIGAFAWPFVLPSVDRGDAHAGDAPVIFVVLLALLALLVFTETGRGGMGPKTVALLGVLGAVMVALRLPGFVAGFSAMFIVVLVAGNAFGPGFGFALGAIGTFASAIFVGGFGPWLPFQIVAVGWVGSGAGLIPKPRRWPARIALLACYGFFAAFAFGAIMNLYFWPFVAGSSEVRWVPDGGFTENLRHYATFYVLTSAAWDLFGAIGNAVLVALLGRPLLAAFDRAARRMRLELG